MANWSIPTSPVGTYDPEYMTNLYGASWTDHWNTSIYGSPQQVGADVLSNCVGYTQGRMLQIYREIYPNYDPAALGTHLFATFNMDAGDGVSTSYWLQNAISLGFQTSSTPIPGYVLCTASHVAVIEREESGVFMVSESGYGDATPWHYWNSIYESGGTWYSSYASTPEILGFFKIPGTDPGGGLPGTGYDRHRGHRARSSRGLNL